MSILRVAGFATILVVVGLGVDYDQQSKQRNLGFGKLPLQDYAQTIPQRINDVKQEKLEAAALAMRQAADPRVHLPEAPEGWIRRDWEPRDATLLAGHAEEEIAAEEALEASERAMEPANGSKPLLGGMMSPKERKSDPQSERYVYQRGSQIVMLEATWDKLKGEPRSFTGMAMTVVIGNINAMTQSEGFAVVQGLPFERVLSDIMSLNADEERPNSFFRAFLGEQVRINVNARATDASVRTLLDGINYDGLNAMLNVPSPDVGSHMPVLPVEAQVEVANLALNLARERSMKKVAEANKRLEKMFSGGKAKEANFSFDRSREMKQRIDDIYSQAATAQGMVLPEGFNQEEQDIAPTQVAKAAPVVAPSADMDDKLKELFSNPGISIGMSDEPVAEKPAQEKLSAKVAKFFDKSPKSTTTAADTGGSGTRGSGEGVKVNRGGKSAVAQGSGSCTIEAGIKRCRMGGD